MIVEVCANGFESAAIAQQAKANRIELCIDLSVGGITPQRTLIEKVVSTLSIETHVLIRPRAGSFVYSEIELEQMITDIHFCKDIGCQGIVSGVLTATHHIDAMATQKLIDAATGLEFTFHRAFDVVPDPIESLQQLKRLGVTRLLSSGQAHKAIEGIDLLEVLKERATDAIQIMPGSGISSTNAIQFKKAGFEMIHLSGIKKSPQAQKDDLFAQEAVGISDLEELQEVIALVTSP